MGHRLERWRALDWRQRRRLLGCSLGLAVIHASLAVAGYTRTRAAIERLSQHRQPRTASAAELADARDLARLAAIAGRHGAVQATCLRRSLLLLGLLRRRGLRPVLHLGMKEREGPFQAMPGSNWKAAPCCRATPATAPSPPRPARQGGRFAPVIIRPDPKKGPLFTPYK